MAKKTWLPALRRQMESKALSIGGGYGSYTMPRVTTWGRRDAAAGWDMTSVIQDGYERSIWVYKSVEIIAGNSSRLPFAIMDGEDEVESHPLLRVMNKRANPLETGRAFRKRLSAQVLLSKRGAFVEVTKSRAGDITRLDLLDPDRVRIVPDLAGDYISYYEFTRPDGVVRNLATERVRWIREPHPIDPFSGTTPIDPSGMSIELDRLARAYNVSFINRDGRPGGVIGVDTDGLDQTELDRIANIFVPGTNHAGEIYAIGTGKGGMNYIDTGARPRDMAYETTSDKAKKEILAAFGVPESMAGNASERTFDNAEQEEFNFWHDPMLPHIELIASAFDGDVDEELDCRIDTSSVEALELPARRRRAEAREEVEGGLRTIKEYRKLREELVIIDNPQTRALWISPAKAPVPGVETDAAALGLADPNATAGADPLAATSPAPEDAAASAQDVVAQAIAEGATTNPEDMAPEGEAAAAVADARLEGGDESADIPGEAEEAVLAARMEGKALETTAVTAPAPNPAYEPGDDASRRVELAVATTLESLLNRQVGVIVARLESPKSRRGTTYWVPENDLDTRAGQEPIDTARVVDTARWVAEAQESLSPTVTAASQESAAAFLTALAAAGALVGPVPLTAAIAGRAGVAPVAAAEEISRFAANAAVKSTMFALATAHMAIEDWLGERIADVDRIITQQVTPDLPSVLEQVRRLWDSKARSFAQSLAVTVAQTAVVGAREHVAEDLVPQVAAPAVGSDSYMVEVPPQVLRIWCTREDESVRATHAAADGQIVRVGEAFLMGGHEVRFPSDPLAPPSVSRWCRCWIRYEWSEGAKFTVRRNASAHVGDTAA